MNMQTSGAPILALLAACANTVSTAGPDAGPLDGDTPYACGNTMCAAGQYCVDRDDGGPPQSCIDITAVPGGACTTQCLVLGGSLCGPYPGEFTYCELEGCAMQPFCADGPFALATQLHCGGMAGVDGRTLRCLCPCP